MTIKDLDYGDYFIFKSYAEAFPDGECLLYRKVETPDDHMILTIADGCPICFDESEQVIKINISNS